MKRAAFAMLLAGFGARLVFGADDATQRRDLAAVIALQGLPCGEVVSYVTQAENDFVASCKDGNKYHVHIKDGRVVVDKQ